MKKYYIYRIEFPNGQFYIGQTSQPFAWMRWHSHVQYARMGKHTNQYIQDIYDDYGCDDWKFEVLLELESDDPYYVGLMETTTIDDHPNTINVRTKKPICVGGIKHKDDPKAYHKAYHRAYDKQRSYSKEYYQKTKHKHKAYYQANKERISKKYYDSKVVDNKVID